MWARQRLRVHNRSRRSSLAETYNPPLFPYQEWEQVRALARVGRDVNAMEEGNQRTALHYAAGYGDCATARALVHSGAHVNARNRAGMTALGWAEENAHRGPGIYFDPVSLLCALRLPPRGPTCKASPLEL